MKDKKLSNGLNVVVVDNPASEVVSLQLWISCGSVNEKETEYGVSHFIEHLLFKGTERHGVGEIAKEVESLGGDLNAFTAKEYTCYYITLPSIYIEQGLSTLKNLVFHPSFVKEEINAEREVIIEEIRRYQDIPSSVASENYFEIHFENHPYSKPILGVENVIRKITREEIKDYYSRFYIPSNSLLIVCGKIPSKDATHKLINDVFGALKDRKNQIYQKVPIAELKDKKTCKVQEMDVNEANIVFGFPVPELLHEDVPALDVLGIVLGQGDSSRLVKSVRLEKGYVTSISSYAYTPRYGGIFNIIFSMEGTSPKFKDDLKNVFSAIYDEIDQMKRLGVNEDEIDKAKTILLSEKVYEREKVEGLATKLGHLISVTGGVEFEKQYFDGLRKVGCEDVIRVLNKYVDINRVSISAVFPNKTEINGETLLKLLVDNFKSSGEKVVKQKPKCYSSHTSVVDSIIGDNDYSFEGNILVQKPEIFKHRSGAKIITRKITSTPLVSMKILMPGGVLYENEGNQGISNLLARTLMFGADDLSFMDIASITDGTASNLNSFSGRNSIGLNIDVMKPFFESILSLSSKILLKPRFNEEYFNTEKKIIEDDIKAIQDNLAQYAKILLLKTMYQKHPYRFEILGTVDNIRKFKRGDVLSFYDKLLQPDKMIFSVAGDFDKDLLIKWVDDLVSKIKKQKEPLPVIPIEPSQTENRITKFKKESKQAHVFVAYKTCSLKSTDRFVFNIINAVLGGQSGRLFINLRDKQSLAYTVSPIELFGPETGYFGAYIASENSKVKKAIDEIRKELNKIKKDKISDEELNRSKNFLIGRHAIGMQSYSEQSSAMGFDEMFGMGYKSMLNYSNNIMHITAEDVKTVAGKYFKDGQENVSIVSNN